MIKPLKNKQKNYVNLVGLGAALLIALGALWFFFWRPAPVYPLGDRLEYVGETRSGSIPFLSDSNPRTDYNYATDLTPEEIVRYFKKATPKDDTPSHNTSSTIVNMLFNTPQGQTFSVFYYFDGQNRMQELQLKQVNKSHVIVINSKDYQLAKDSI